MQSHCALSVSHEPWRRSHGAGDVISVIESITFPQPPVVCMMVIGSDCEADVGAAVNIYLIGTDGLGYVIGWGMVRRKSLETAEVTVNILVNVL